jgi:hypothetical protein
VDRHRLLCDTVEDGDIGQLRAALYEHYMAGFPEHR